MQYRNTTKAVVCAFLYVQLTGWTVKMTNRIATFNAMLEKNPWNIMDRTPN